MSKWMVLFWQQFSILVNGKLVQIRRIHTLMHPVDLAALRAFQFLLVMFRMLIFMVFDRASKTLTTLIAFWIIHCTRLFQFRTMVKINDNQQRSSYKIYAMFALTFLLISLNVPRKGLEIRNCGLNNKVCHASNGHFLKSRPFL